MASERYPIDKPPWRELIRVLAHRELGRDSGAAVAQWAGEALAAGSDSPSLRILAGLLPPINEYEVDRYLGEVAREHGISLLVREQLLVLFATLVAQDVVDGAVSPEVGVKEIYEVFNRSGSSRDLGVWTGLDDALAMAKSGIYGTVEDAESAIVREAKRLAQCPESMK